MPYLVVDLIHNRYSVTLLQMAFNHDHSHTNTHPYLAGRLGDGAELSNVKTTFPEGEVNNLLLG